MNKDYSQCIYNKVKGSLDHGSECDQRVRLKDKLFSKRKYVFRMLDTAITDG